MIATAADTEVRSARRNQPRKPLLATLAVSILLHLLLILLPYLGRHIPGQLLKGKGQSVTVVEASLRMKPVLERAPSGKAHKPALASSSVTQAEPDDSAHEASLPTEPPAGDGEPGFWQRLLGEHDLFDLAPLPEDKYFAPEQLSEKPVALDPVDLDPPAAQRIVAAGKVVMKLWINERGEVDNVSVLSSELPEEIERFATDAFKKTRFAPAMAGGQAVPTVMKIEVTYEDPRVPRLLR